MCPVVEVSSAFLKKCDQGVDDSPFIILNNSIKSALFLLSSRDHSPNWHNGSLFSYDNDLRRENIHVKECCILSCKKLVLVIMWVPCGWAIFKVGLTVDLYWVVSTAGFLHFIALLSKLSKPNIRLALEYIHLYSVLLFLNVNVTPRSFSQSTSSTGRSSLYYHFHSVWPYTSTH